MTDTATMGAIRSDVGQNSIYPPPPSRIRHSSRAYERQERDDDGRPCESTRGVYAAVIVTMTILISGGCPRRPTRKLSTVVGDGDRRDIRRRERLPPHRDVSFLLLRRRRRRRRDKCRGDDDVGQGSVTRGGGGAVPSSSWRGRAGGLPWRRYPCPVNAFFLEGAVRKKRRQNIIFSLNTSHHFFLS